eukprot:c48354_g1_i1.p2 GENE.c48354_g1_i1~~c48354_g1_i1.p2  ORF type:complete len:250 (-),score=40.70 c48354_g1_i1:21-770(-)
MGLDSFELVALGGFLLSTPIAVAAVFLGGQDRHWVAIANSYGFSIGYNLLYAYPLLFPFLTSAKGFKERLHKATMNWIVWLTVFTELSFQIPHNLFVKELHAIKGSVLEWPFFSYGQSDNRWNSYNGGSGLAPEVWLINVNDAALGALVLLALIHQVRSSGWARPSLPLILVTLFRDATLFRETVEYMWDHHRKNYPHTTHDPILRPHAIACLWLINIAWLVAPLLTVVWASQHLIARADAQHTGKKLK